MARAATLPSRGIFRTDRLCIIIEGMDAIIDNKISIFEQEIGIIIRLLEIGKLSGNVANTVVYLHIQSKAIAKESESFYAYISCIERNPMIDPGDQLDHRLNDMLQKRGHGRKAAKRSEKNKGVRTGPFALCGPGRRLRNAGVPLETRKVLLHHVVSDITVHYSPAEIRELIDAVKGICTMEKTTILRAVG